MNNNIIENLKNRAVKLVGYHPLSLKEIANVESNLNLRLSNSFKDISSKCSYEYLSAFNFFNFGSQDEGSVISATLGAFNYFSNRGEYMVLYQDDAGVLLMTDISEKSEKIYWCALEDFERVIRKDKLLYNHKFFSSFTDFFVYLLDEEEKSRAIAS